MSQVKKTIVEKIGVSTLIYSTILLILVTFSTFSFDLIGFFAEHNFTQKAVAYTVIASSILFIPRCTYWHQLAMHKKPLLASMVLLFTAINFNMEQSFLFTAVFALAVFYYYSIEKRFYKPNFVSILMLIYFAHLVLSLSWSLNKAEGISYLTRLSPLVFIPLLFSFFKFDKKDFELILLALFKMATFMAVLSIVSWILQSRLYNFNLLDGLQFKKASVGFYPISQATYAWSLFKHPTYWSILFLTAISATWFYLHKKDTEFKVSKSEMLFAFIAILIVTSISASRVMLVNFVLVNAIGLLYTLRHNKKNFAIASAFLTIITLVVIVFFNAKIMEFIDDPARQSLRAAAYESINQNTWLGTGLGGMKAYINNDNPLLASLRSSEVMTIHIHPHNQFIADAMQTGIFGLSLISLLVSTIIYKCIRYKNVLLLLVTIIFLFIMNIETPLNYMNGIFAFTVYMSFFTQKKLP